MLRRYVHGAGVDEPVLWWEGSGTADGRSLLADRQGSIIATAPLAGGTSTVSLYTYGPYGERTSWGGSRFAYTGQIALPEASLYHYKARAYDPARGWFLQTDPIGYEAGDFNLYAYVGGDPVNKSDPTGLWLFPWEKPITVVGDAKDRKPVQDAVDRGSKTPRAKELLRQIDGGRQRGHPITVQASDSGKAKAETPGTKVIVNPNYRPKIMTKEGPVTASTTRIVWHEIGHAVTGTGDTGTGKMDNINQNENPIARALGEPERTSYAAPR